MSGEPLAPPSSSHGDDLVAIGRISRTQGNAGAVRLFPFFEPLDRFDEMQTNEVVLRFPQQAPGPQKVQTLHISGFSYHKHFVILEFDEIPDMNAAETLREAEVLVRQEHLWPLDEQEYFSHQLVGLHAIDADTGDEVGNVSQVVDGAAHDYLKIHAGGKNLLLPFIREFVKEVSLQRGVIKVKVPEGLDTL